MPRKINNPHFQILADNLMKDISDDINEEIKKNIQSVNNTASKFKSSYKNLTVVYAQEPFPEKVTKSIFLAGPTPRVKEVPSWRPMIVDYLDSIGYDGIVFVPEMRDGIWNGKREEEFVWERNGLDRADVIFFYIPRDLTIVNGKPAMPAFTTNIEYGIYSESNRAVVCIPEDKITVSSNWYIKRNCEKNVIPFFYDFKDAIDKALELIGPGALRTDSEVQVPLLIWNHKQFQDWYTAQKKVGNKLTNFKCMFNFLMLKARLLFLWICHVEVYIASEDRIKSIEFVLSRTDLSSVVLYHRSKTGNMRDTSIVLIKEFRSPCRNDECMVYELPSGSSNDINRPADKVAADESSEEIGVKIDTNRLKPVGNRQAVATLSAHINHAYAVELTDEEFEMISNKEGEMNGNIEESEQTYTVIKTIGEILDNNLVDWTNVGIILASQME